MGVWAEKLSVLVCCSTLLLGCTTKTEKEIVMVPEIKTVEVPVAIPGTKEVISVPQIVAVDKSVGIKSLPKPIDDAPEEAKQMGGAVGKILSAMGTTGTGFFISKDGLFLTNEHVIPKAACAARRCPGFKIMTGFHKNGTTKSYSDFEVIAQTAGLYDFALIKVHLKDGEQVEHLELALTPNDFDKGSDGSTHLVLGHPGGAGLKYAEAKPLRSDGVSITFQGIVVPGNSGGPLVDLKLRKVIGLVKSMQTPSVKDGSGSAYFENENHATSIWDLEAYIKKEAGVSILAVDQKTDMKTLNLASESLSEPDADDFGSILRRPLDDVRIPRALSLFMRLMGSKHETRALSLMLQKTPRFSGPVNLMTLNNLLYLSLAAGRPLALDEADREALQAELVASTETQKISTLILMNYFDDAVRSGIQKMCVDSIPETPEYAMLVPYFCATNKLGNQKSIFPIYAEWLTKVSGYSTIEDLSSVVTFLNFAAPFGTNGPEDIKAIEQIAQFVEEKVRQIRTLMHNDGFSLGIIKGQLSIGSFKDTFAHGL